MELEETYKLEFYSSAERVTAIPAKALLVQAGVISSDGAIVHSEKKRSILDNACGTGILTSLLFNLEAKSEGLEVLCGDIAESMVESVKQKIAKNSWNATAQILDSQAMTLPDDTYDFVFANFGMQAIPNSPVALAEMVRVTAPKGIIGLTTAADAPWLPMLLPTFSTFTFPTPPPSIPENVFRMNDQYGANWESSEYIRSMLISNSSLDPNTIRIERYSFELGTRSNEDKNLFAGMAVQAAGIIMSITKWTEEQKKVCMEDDKLLKAMRALLEEKDAVNCVAWITTAQKLGVPA